MMDNCQRLTAKRAIELDKTTELIARRSWKTHFTPKPIGERIMDKVGIDPVANYIPLENRCRQRCVNMMHGIRRAWNLFFLAWSKNPEDRAVDRPPAS